MKTNSKIFNDWKSVVVPVYLTVDQLLEQLLSIECSCTSCWRICNFYRILDLDKPLGRLDPFLTLGVQSFFNWVANCFAHAWIWLSSSTEIVEPVYHMLAMWSPHRVCSWIARKVIFSEERLMNLLTFLAVIPRPGFNPD